MPNNPEQLRKRATMSSSDIVVMPEPTPASRPKRATMSSDLVVIDYADLLASPCESGDLPSRLAAAFGGHGSLGIVAIKGVPSFLEAKSSLLPLAHTLAHLPKAYLEEDLTDAASMYNAGWSHGKEKLGDEPDFAKGSFYFNPLTDEPGTPDLRRRYPASYPRNVWPDDGTVPNFEASAKRLGRIMHGVVVRLAQHIDALARSRIGDSYPEKLLHDAMRTTDKAKGRLLYYFPLDDDRDDKDRNGDGSGDGSSSWIGWHNDSGFLTALAGDMFVDDSTGEPLDRSLVDPSAGLYAVDRSGSTRRIDIPDDCMAVQIGECTQIVTGGAVVATPHCVRGGGTVAARGGDGGGGTAKVRVARISHPCFIDTGPTFPLSLPLGCSRDEVIKAGVGSSRVPPLEDRWTEDMPFGDFLETTFAKYYDWTKVSNG